MNKGYSLIEVLIATAIFAVVLIVGTSSFATISRISREARIYQDLSQSGIFVSETLARSIRNASGKRTSSGGFIIVPFKINSPDPQCATLGSLMSGNNLEIHGNKNRSFYADDDELLLKDLNTNEVGSLLTKNVLLEGGICFRGIDYTKTDFIKAQPYIIFEFTLKHAGSNVKKTFRSAVAGREYF